MTWSKPRVSRLFNCCSVVPQVTPMSAEIFEFHFKRTNILSFVKRRAFLGNLTRRFYATVNFVYSFTDLLIY